MEGKEEDVNLGANKFSERQPLGTSAQVQDKDYKEPPPAAFFEPGELSSWSFYRAGIAEFMATFLFLYITVLTVMGYANEKNKCATVGTQGIAWAFGGMIFALVYCIVPCALQEFQGSCPFIKSILLLDSEGKRVAVKYYSDDWPTVNAKLAFEKSVFTKTQKTNARTEAEISMFENNVVVYKFIQDLHFFVTGGDDENELILATVLQGFYDAVALLLRGNVDKREALENLDLILLCLDEIVDGGMVLETDANVIAGKVASHSVDASAPLSEQTLSQALATAREHLTRSLLK